MTEKQISDFKQKALQYASNFDVCCYLDSHAYEDKYGKHDCIIGFGKENELTAQVGTAFISLKTFAQENKDWMFGLLTYDLKDEIEEIGNRKKDQLNFPDLYFFIPKYLISIKENYIQVLKGEKEIINQKLATPITQQKTGSYPACTF